LTVDVKAPVIIRVLHWAIALSFLLSAFLLSPGDLPHRLSGILGGALVAARLVLAFRYRMTYLNPRAVVVYLLIWLSIIGLGVTGWMSQLDAFWGNRLLQQSHGIAAYLLMALVFVHLSGVFLDAWRHRRKTWMKMIRG